MTTSISVSRGFPGCAVVLVLLILSCSHCIPLPASLLSNGHAPQLLPTREPLTAVTQLRELVFYRKASMLTAHCDGGSARHHKHFYPSRVVCIKTNHAATIDAASWSCTPRGPHSVLTKIRAPRVSCIVSQHRKPDNDLWPQGVELIDTGSCSLTYKLEFRSASLAALSVLAFLLVFSMFALTAHTLLSVPFAVAPSDSANCDSIPTVNTDIIAAALKHTQSTSLLSTIHNDYGLARDFSRDSLNDEHADLDDGESDDNEDLCNRIPFAGYGSFARLLRRDLSDGSLTFSSDPPSPPVTPPLRPVQAPTSQELRQAELLTELF